ncbi:hypothetical protein MLD38_036089 [Melastoma candidum]|nr:hypothetical protein MLD38_036089 [Melastoma candidum]
MLYRDSVTVRVKGLEITFVRILSVFTSIDLSENGFWGPIPAEIGMLKSLKGLNLSHNGFTRSIPPSIGDLCSLEWLDLSANMFDGVIPQHLSDITSLAVLNLSENQLSGQIPTGRQFNTFGSSSFGGNPGLCGFPLLNSCSNKADTPPPPSHIVQKAHEGHGDVLLWWIAASIGCGPGLLLGISMGYLFLKTGRPTWLARFMYRKDAKVMKMSSRKARSSQR